ncbi:MAG TPA: serine hydroxymethyltransferase, partial [Coriobacteriia bacterium]|nr:serine hydroxymethyltransferase [Coriobacteriia bacterium]
PFVTSGIRVGSPAMTTRGFSEGEAHTVGCLIAKALFNRHDSAMLATITEEIRALIDAHPLYPEL